MSALNVTRVSIINRMLKEHSLRERFLLLLILSVSLWFYIINLLLECMRPSNLDFVLIIFES